MLTGIPLRAQFFFATTSIYRGAPHAKKTVCQSPNTSATPHTSNSESGRRGADGAEQAASLADQKAYARRAADSGAPAQAQGARRP